MKQLEIWTDGACSGNPGPGGWGALLRYNQHEKTISGGEENTTNNRMELLAVIRSLEIITEQNCQITIWTDSNYVKNGITVWIHNWQKNNWKTSDKKDVKNMDLWQNLLALSRQHKIEWKWVKGHSGNPENDLVDELARKACEKYKK